MTTPSAQPDVQPIQIGRPAPGHEFESMPTLRLIEDRFAQLLSGEFSHTFGAHIEVSLENTDSMRWGELKEQLSQEESCYNLLELDGLGGLGALVMSQNLFFNLLELLLGDGAGSGTKFGQQAKTRLSSVENRVLRRITNAFGRCMEQAWRPVVPMHITYLRTEMKADHISLARSEELVMASRFKLTLKASVDEEGSSEEPLEEGQPQEPQEPEPSLHMTLVLPLSSVSSKREDLAAGSYDRQVGPKEEGWGDKLNQVMEEVYVDVAAELGRALLSLEQLMEMQVGQVIRLDRAPNGPTSLTISGLPKFLGEVVVHHGNLAVSITDLIKEPSSSSPSTLAPESTPHHDDSSP